MEHFMTTLDAADALRRNTIEAAAGDRVGPFSLPSLGWLGWAKWTARRVERHVSAYREFAARREGPWAFADRPVTSKESYILRFPTAELMAENQHGACAIFRSSGASGNPVYWPYLRDGLRHAAWGMRRYLEACFAIHHRKTLAVVGAALGSWVGGDPISWILKSAALRAPYDFSVFAPGNTYAEIIEIIAEAAPRVDQVLLFLCPSHVPYLELLAESLGRPLPLAKLRYVLFGESILERVRLSLQDRAGVPLPEPFMVSFYGSADTGLLGAESPESVALRKLLTRNEGLASELGFSQPIPHLFHYAAPDAYLELLAGELHVTRWQGIPLVRYNLHDRVRFYRWRSLRRAVLQSSRMAAADGPLREVLRRSRMMLSDLVAVEGRSGTLIILGSNFSEADLDEAVRTPSLADLLTGVYKARIGSSGGRQFLEFELELRPGVTLDAEAAERVYRELVHSLGRVQPEFRNDWEKIYRSFHHDPAQRILRLEWHPWPELSRELEERPKRSSIEL
jgi:phenylacetate-CoA ligase